MTPGGVSLPEAPPGEGLSLRRVPGVEAKEPLLPAASADAFANPLDNLDKEGLKDLLKRTTDLVETMAPNRHLKYEVIDEAGLVQVQVIDTMDGNIVRKIPADEIVKLVSRIRETLSDRLDVVV